jgi:hypothetical protein
MTGAESYVRSQVFDGVYLRMVLSHSIFPDPNGQLALTRKLGK